MSVTVAPLGAQALGEAAQALGRGALLGRYGLSQEGLLRLLQGAHQRGEGLLGAYGEGQGPMLGLAWYLPRGALGTAAYLRLLLVAEGAQRRGVGGQLVAAFEAACMVPKGGFFVLTEQQGGAEAFYGRHGYRPVGPLPGFVQKGRTELLLWKSP